MSTSPIDIGSRRELFLDEYLVEQMVGCKLVLHEPLPQEVAIEHDQPWEGNTSFYHTVFRDGDLFRMYYRGSNFDEAADAASHDEVACYAESSDGIHWEKPDLGLFEFDGSKKNNIVWNSTDGSHDFVPFKDENPSCDPAKKYKAVGRKGKEGLIAYVSADALRWERLQPEPIITKGAFDSQNLAFWDELRECYVDYHRDFRDGVRDVVSCTSTDFVDWTDPEWISYPGAPPEHLYTNQIIPYYRAPHIYLGFPKRYILDRNPQNHRGKGVSDAVFMSSRDGYAFKRWTEAYIRPGLQQCRWVNRNNFIAWGILETAPTLPDTPPELSLYCCEGYYRGPASRMRRYTVRLDGFVSIQARLSGGEFTTKPFTFSGSSLELNFSTSAAGRLDVEVLDAEGKRIPGFEAEAFGEIYGDSVDRKVRPKGADLAKLAGSAIRLRIRLADADLYAMRFC